MKKFFILGMLILMAISAVNCFASTFSNDGMVLSIPEKYEDILVVETPQNDERGILFSVSEKESIEVAKTQGYSWDGAGWLYSIGRISEEELHELLYSAIPGRIVFAKDESENYYVYYHPTDVRLFREDYNDPKGWEQWTALNEWSSTVRDSFVLENEALTAKKYGNTDIDIYLYRIMYDKDVKYTVSTTQYGPVQSGKIDASEYIKPLTEGVVYTRVENEEAPDGEYVVLNFPDIDIRFDFFFMEGKENYIRQTWFNGEHEMLYKAEFEDKSLKASSLMNDLYLAMVLADSLGYTADDMVGVWADKYAGRCSIEIAKGDAEDQYVVNIWWSSSANEKYFWSMTAEKTKNASEIRYEDAKLSVITFTSDDESSENIVYENGTGSFSLLSTNEIVWNDETGHAADDMVFVNAG